MNTRENETTAREALNVIETIKDIATGEGSVMDIIADETKDLADKTIAPLTQDTEEKHN